MTMTMNTKGTALAEYGMLLALVAVVAIVAIGALGSRIAEIYTDTAGALSSMPVLAPNAPPPMSEADIPLVALDPAYRSYADPGLGDDFVDVNRAGYQVQSVALVVSDIAGSATLTLLGEGSGRVSVEGRPAALIEVIEQGQSLRLILEPAESYATTRTVVLLIDGAPYAQFSATTRPPPDLVPNPFDIPDLTGVANGSSVSFPAVTISGLEVNEAPIATGVGPFSQSISISGQGNPEFRVDGGPWATAGEVVNGSVIEVRMTASSEYSSTHQAEIEIGGLRDSFAATTQSSGMPFGFSMGGSQLGLVDISDFGSDAGLVTTIPVEMGGVAGFDITSQPSSLSDTALRLIAQPDLARVVLWCDAAPDCAGSFSFMANITSWNPAGQSIASFSIEILHAP